jgi:hypothetical protein
MTTTNSLTAADVAEAIRDELEAAMEAKSKAAIKMRLEAALGWLKGRTEGELLDLAAAIAGVNLDRKHLIEVLEEVRDAAEDILAQFESDESD